MFLHWWKLIKYSLARLNYWIFYWNSRQAGDRVDLWMALSRSKESSSPQHLLCRPHKHRNLGYLIIFFLILPDFAVILRNLLLYKSIKPSYIFESVFVDLSSDPLYTVNNHLFVHYWHLMLTTCTHHAWRQAKFLFFIQIHYEHWLVDGTCSKVNICTKKGWS